MVQAIARARSTGRQVESICQTQNGRDGIERVSFQPVIDEDERFLHVAARAFKAISISINEAFRASSFTSLVLS